MCGENALAGSAERIVECAANSRHIHDAARFFEAPNGGALHPDYDLALKPTSGCMPRAYPTRAMKKRESATREEATFQMSFPDLSNGKIFIPQEKTGAGDNDISRGTNNHARAMEGENLGGRFFI